MEVFKGMNINALKGQVQLKNRINTQHTCTYFETYETNKSETICLISNPKQTSNQKIKKIIFRMQECSRCLNQIGSNKQQQIKIFSQKIQSQTNTALIYEDTNMDKTAKNLRGKSQPYQLLDLAFFLVNLVNKIKMCNGYFGGFLPHRLLQKQQQFCIIGGQFFSKKCTTNEFISQNLQLKEQLSQQWKYQSPELYNQKGQLSYASDMFVVGCILFQLITNQYPFKSKQSLISRQINAHKNFSSMTKFICQKILQPRTPPQRAEPAQILQMLELQKGKTMFNTCKLPTSILNQAVNKPSFFNNFQQFIVKCTTETQGWILYYCQNLPNAPQQKYLHQILTKVGKKHEKANKIISLIEKFAQKSIHQQNTVNVQQEDYSYSILKVGIFIMNLLRKMPYQIIQNFHNSFTQNSSQIVSKKPKNQLISVIFKIIAFKVTLQTKFPQFSGNFHIRIENIQKISVQSLDYLSQYCLKIISYLSIFADKESPDMKPCQNCALISLCDQLYDATSTLIYSLMSMKKDSSLKILSREQISQSAFKKLDSACSQIVNKIGKLCNSNSVFSSHQIYSVNSDYYQYQQDLCLMYCPVKTSYQYFYLDKNQYKGLKLPKDYSKIYQKDVKNQFDCFEQEQTYENRKPMLNRRSSTKPVNLTVQPNKINKVAFSSINQPSSINPVPLNLTKNASESYKSQTQKNISQNKQTNDFQAFMTNTKSNTKQKSNDQLSTNNNSSASNLKNQNNESLQNLDQSWLQAKEQDILSYDWLKKTQKTVNKHFQKPQVDSVIYIVYQNICKGLKLHQLIQALTKNKKVIIDPNQILFQKVIGSGSAGQVYIGKYQQNIVAIKKVKTASNPNALKQFQREVLTYIKIKTHPCLVSLVGLTKYNQDYFLLTEFCDGGSLFDLLHKKVNQIQLSWAQRVSIALDIAQGMEFLHYMNPPVVHRDLKSLNVFMIKKNNNWVAKVADFGLSRSPQAGMMTSALGTLHWMAPELLSNKQYSLKVDVYSFGIVLWQICCRKTPYHNIPNQMGIVKHVVLQKGRPLLELINQNCPQQLISLMKKCWKEQPEERPYFPEIVAQLRNIKL